MWMKEYAKTECKKNRHSVEKRKPSKTGEYGTQTSTSASSKKKVEEYHGGQSETGSGYDVKNPGQPLYKGPTPLQDTWGKIKKLFK